MSDVMILRASARLGPYEILAPAGAGGMGEVYKARDIRLDRMVAIKVLANAPSALPEVRQRFEHEARAVSAINHPHICSLFDIGREDGMDLVRSSWKARQSPSGSAKARCPSSRPCVSGSRLVRWRPRTATESSTGI